MPNRALLSCRQLRRLPERGRHPDGSVIGSLVDLASAIDRGFEWDQERVQAHRIGRVSEDLAHRERAALPCAFTGEGGGDAGA